MKTMPFIIAAAISTLSIAANAADHHHSQRGPNGGFLVALGSSQFYAELCLSDGQLVTARVLDQKRKPVSTAAPQLTLTFIESDGEKEDYRIDAFKEGGPGVFQKKSAHVVHHILRDRMSVTATIDGKKHGCASFAFPFGPHGGHLVALEPGGHYAELQIDGDVVNVFLLNGKKRAAKTSAKEITLTFTEADGEVEDYQIPAAKTDAKGARFMRDDDHVVKHIKRDPMRITVISDGKSMKSRKFGYPKSEGSN